MSVYNFNDREHETHDTHDTLAGYSRRTNGTAGYHQMESDFLSRNMAHQTSQADNSVQLTRPTSKTALLVRQRRAMLEQLSCFICKGYLIDAITLDECMDSFCKSCIVIHLRTHNSCPKCCAVIGHDNPLSAMKPDKVLQDIVYKIIPGLYDDEMKRRRDFYREFYGATQQSSSDEEADSDSSSRSLTVQGTSLSGERYGVVLHPKPFYKPTDSIDLSIEPQTRGDNTTIYFDNQRQSIVTCFTGSLQQRDLNNDSGSVFSSVDSQLFKTYLRCPAKFTILQLKKFIAAKFNICRDDTIHLLYLNELLLDEYSLIDVAYIYDWRGIEHMQLFYKIERDLAKVNTNDRQQDNHFRAGKLTRQSVGISTQTVKRVCIDPKPKFYEEKNNNDVSIKTESRSMRPRTTETQTPIGIRSVPTNSIIRTVASDASHKTFSIQTNGTSTRDQGTAEGRASSRHAAEQAFTTKRGSRGSTGSETRSLRSQVAAAIKTISTPEINSQPKNSAQAQGPSVARGAHVPSNSAGNDTPASRDNSVRQLVPYAINRITASSPTNATQSSIVTLASFIEAKARNNMITSVSSTSASVQTLINDTNVTGISNSMASFEPQQHPQPDYSQTLRVNSGPKVPGTPQLAYSIVTERGITINVRGLNNHETAARSISAVTSNPSSHQDMVARTPSQTSSTNSAAHSSMTSSNNTGNSTGGHAQTAQTSTSNLNLMAGRQVSQSSSSQRITEDTVTSRHNLKAKPVYKLFPDPTKLKSPNLKKLGFTAKH